jgi:signal peptidase I
MPILTALFDLNGTATRKSAFRVFLVLAAGLAGLMALGRFAPTYQPYGYPFVGLIVVWWLATAVRRLHDAGFSGVWVLAVLVPYVGIVASVVLLMLRQGARPFNDSHAGLRAAGTVGLVVLALFYFSRVLWTPYWIPAESMKPALLVGDYLFVRHRSDSALVRGDVVAFRHPVTGVPMVKRLIGLPQDRIAISGGIPVLNDIALTQSDAGVLRETYGPQGPAGNMPRCANAVVGVGGICEKPLRREAQPDGRSYLVADIEATAFPDETDTFTVPDGQLFFLGDNRDNSMDSRFAQGAGGLGFVPAENVIGRGAWVLFSSAGASLWAVWDWRGDRIFRAVE